MPQLRWENDITVRTDTPPAIARMMALTEKSLDDDKAENIIIIDLLGKSTIADYMVIASGRSQRHVGAMAEHLREKLKAVGARLPTTEGMPQCDWVLIDAGDIIIHIFRPEVRDFYNLEKMWAHPFAEPEAGLSA